ncbi:MAG: pyruvate formate lyase family protein, partial [Longimicrobiales bacterium]
STATVKADDARIDALKEQLRTTPQEVDYERHIILRDVYAETAGYAQVIRRAKLIEAVVERKQLYIDDNLFVGSITGTVNGVYPYPEWNVEWMKEENTVDKSKTPELRAANEWALEYWEPRSLKTRTEEILARRYGYDPETVYGSGLVASFHDWPGGGGNLNYPRIYQEGAASIIKEIEERMMSMEMRLPNTQKFYFYEAALITLRAFIRLSHRYAELARELAAKEEAETRKAELIAIAETCEHVPEHPARNLREAMQAHFLAHIFVELEQPGCGYSEAYLGQNMEPYYQADKAAGRITYDDAVFMFKSLFVKLNEVGYYYGEKVKLQNELDLGQTITLAGYTAEGDDATADMDYAILDAQEYLAMPQPPLSLAMTPKTPGKLIEKALDVIATGIGMPQFVNPDVMIKRALNLWGYTERNGRMSLEKARRTCIGACVGSYVPYETGHPVEGQPNMGKALELTMHNGFDPRTQKQVGPKTGELEDFKDFEELYTAFEQQTQFQQDVLRRGSWIASMLTADFIPVPWRSILTKGCLETGLETWNGGANYSTVAHICVGGVDAANGLMAVKDLVFDKKKLTMKELREALLANFEGEHEKVRRMCYEDAPKYGNDIDEVDKLLLRVNNSILAAFNNVDGGGNYISQDQVSTPDQYTKSSHNLMGMVTGALPTGKKAGVALTDGSLSAMPGTDTKGATALVMSASKGNEPIKWASSHMNMKLPPDQLDTRMGREGVLNLVRTLFENNGYHIQFNVLDTEMLRDAQKHPKKYRDLVVRVAGFSAFFTQLNVGVQNEIIERTLQRC